MAARRAAAPSVGGVMVGRGALVTPWIFGELSSGRTWCVSASERVRYFSAYKSDILDILGPNGTCFRCFST
jgi:tRNA-dihydrouridine synthase